MNTEVQVALRSSTIIRDSDIHCFRGHHFSNNITVKVQTKDTIAKEFHPKEPKVRQVKQTNLDKFSKKAHKEKKKKKDNEK